MLGEEPRKTTLDSSAGDNRIVCAVIYTVWHWEVSSTLKGLGSLANGLGPPHGNKIPIVPPRLLRDPHYLFSIQLKIIKSSSKHTLEGIGHFINKWRTRKTVCSITVLNRKTRSRILLAFSPAPPNLLALGQPGIWCSEIKWSREGEFTLAPTSRSPGTQWHQGTVLPPWRQWFSGRQGLWKECRGQSLNSSFARKIATVCHHISRVDDGTNETFHGRLLWNWEVENTSKEASAGPGRGV